MPADTGGEDDGCRDRVRGLSTKSDGKSGKSAVTRTSLGEAARTSVTAVSERSVRSASCGEPMLLGLVATCGLR